MLWKKSQKRARARGTNSQKKREEEREGEEGEVKSGQSHGSEGRLPAGASISIRLLFRRECSIHCLGFRKEGSLGRKAAHTGHREGSRQPATV